jgi:hypothetical protein
MPRERFRFSYNEFNFPEPYVYVLKKILRCKTAIFNTKEISMSTLKKWLLLAISLCFCLSPKFAEVRSAPINEKV